MNTDPKGTAPRRWWEGRLSLWDLAILVLGLNVWVTALVIPALHLERSTVGSGGRVAMGLALLLLLVGVARRHALLLLGGFPALVLLAVMFEPKLVGINVYTAWTFVLVAVDFVAFSLGTALLLRVADAPPDPPVHRRLRRPPLSARWRRRRRVYLQLTLVSALLPALLIYSIFLHPEVQDELRRFYPERASSAGVLFGVFGLALWLVLFHSYLLAPLRAHIRGDPQTQIRILRLRRESRRSGPRPQFYVWVAVALILMTMLFVDRCHASAAASTVVSRSDPASTRALSAVQCRAQGSSPSVVP